MSKKILTQEGLKKLQDELEHLKTVERKQIAGRIQAAKELGDLSENAEYSEAKEQQALTDIRIAEIEMTIKNSELISGASATGGKVAIGSTIKVKTNGKERTFEIVGSNEADPASGKISHESPLAASFLGRKSGDKVEVQTPRGEVKYLICSVQ